MILNFPGGVCPQVRTILGNDQIQHTIDCSIVCIPASDDASSIVAPDCRVKRGTVLGESDGMPVCSSVSGVFKGLTRIEGRDYFVVVNDKSGETETPFEPETRPISDLTFDDIVDSARRFGITDARSGLPLYRLLLASGGKCRRVVVDCTESDPRSAINYRLCIEHAREMVFGAKLLVNAVSALKCVFAAEYYKGEAFDSLLRYASDEKLFAMAEMEEKYPYGDRALMYGLYVTSLKENETALDKGVLIVSAETAVALYRAMSSGMPQLDRYVCLCGEGFDKGQNLCVPRGITVRDLVLIAGGLKNGYKLIQNSLLSGRPASGTLSDSALSLVSVKPKKVVRTNCIACGECASVCPVRLYPADVLTGSSRHLTHYCISCGACEYICPSGIPLLGLIKPSGRED